MLYIPPLWFHTAVARGALSVADSGAERNISSEAARAAVAVFAAPQRWRLRADPERHVQLQRKRTRDVTDGVRRRRLA